MTEFTRDGANAVSNTGHSVRPTATPQSSSRSELIAQYGPHVGAALAEIELAARKKNAERLRDLRTQLTALNEAISAQLKASDETVAAAQERMDATYVEWLAASEAHAAALASREASVAGLRGQCTALIKEISAPPAHFASMVKQWGRPPDYTGGEEPREFDNTTTVHVHPNWAPADPNHSPAPREIWNTPADGPGGRLG